MGVFTNIPRDSEKGIGGIAYCYVANFGDVTVSHDSSSGYDTFSIVDTSTYSTLDEVFTKFVFRKETASYTSPVTGAPAQGTTMYAQTLNMTFARNSVLKRNQLQIMGNSEMVVVVVDRNGDAWCLGNDPDSGLDLTGGDLVSGTAPGDLNGVSAILTCNSKYAPGKVADASLSSFE